MTALQAAVFFFGILSALGSSIALLNTMPPKVLWYGRGLHWLVAGVQLYTAVIYSLVLIGVLLPTTYARFVYPVSVLILSPGWVIWFTHALTRRFIGV